MLSCSATWPYFTVGRPSAGVKDVEVNETGAGAEITKLQSTVVHRSSKKQLPGPLKTTVRYHFTPIRMVITNKQKTRVGSDVQKLEPLYIVGRNEIWCSHHEKQHGSPSNN